MDSTISGHDGNVTFNYNISTKQLSWKGTDDSSPVPSLDPSKLVGVSYTGRGNWAIVLVKQDSANDEPCVEVLTARELPEEFTRDWETKPQTVRQSESLAHFERVPSTHVIVSTLAGTGKAADFYKSMVKPFFNAVGCKEHRDYVHHETKSADSVSKLVKNIFLPAANAGVVQRLVLLSGDGAVVDILNALHAGSHSNTYREPIIALLPLGTGNALANSSGVNQDQTHGLSTLARGYPDRLPMFRTEFSPGAVLVTDEGQSEAPLPLKMRDGTAIMFGAVVCSYGFHATLVAESDTVEYRKHGAARFQMIAKELLSPTNGSKPHAYLGEISLLNGRSGNWEPVDRREHAYAVITPLSHLEQTFCVSPSSQPLEDKLRVVHFGPPSGDDDIMRLMNAAYDKGKHVDDPLVSYDETEGLKVELKGLEKNARWRRVCVDGKIVRLEEDGWVKVLKERSKLVMLEHLPVAPGVDLIYTA